MIPNAVETRACFQEGSLRTEQVLSLLEPEALGFSPVSIRVGSMTKGYEPLSRKLLERVRNLRTLDVIEVREAEPPKKGRTFLFARDVAFRFQMLCWNLGALEEVQPETLTRVMSMDGFSSAAVFDARDVLQQSTASLEVHRNFGWSLRSLKVSFDADLEREVVDISKNAGRADRIPGMWIIPGWKLWFAGRALAYFPRERLLSFPDAEEIRENERSVFLRLFDLPTDAATPRGRATQLAFREWLEIDRLVASLEEKRSDEGGVNIEEGVFERGGKRRVTIRRDRNGHIAPKRDAWSQEVFILDQAGRVVERIGPHPVDNRDS
jgi:hypothetical protein